MNEKLNPDIVIVSDAFYPHSLSVLEFFKKANKRTTNQKVKKTPSFESNRKIWGITLSQRKKIKDTTKIHLNTPQRKAAESTTWTERIVKNKTHPTICKIRPIRTEPQRTLPERNLPQYGSTKTQSCFNYKYARKLHRGNVLTHVNHISSHRMNWNLPCIPANYNIGAGLHILAGESNATEEQKIFFLKTLFLWK